MTSLARVDPVDLMDELDVLFYVSFGIRWVCQYKRNSGTMLYFSDFSAIKEGLFRVPTPCS